MHPILLPCKHHFGSLDYPAPGQVLKAVTQTVEVAITAFVQTGHTITFSLDEKDVSLSLRPMRFPWT
jgi:hypothetical protein